MTLIKVSKKHKCEVLICAVERGDDAFIPNGPFILRENDRVSFVASPRHAKEFFEKIASAYADCPNIIYEICNEPKADGESEEN